jgi:hypothetical protein
MSTQHTKGPWTYKKFKGIHNLMMGDKCAMSSEDYYPWVPENPADWTLMAAAPDLLEAAKLGLKEAESWIHDLLDGTSSAERALKKLDPIRAAIAKATGETK